jgi:Ca-activated chloride channel family protein
VARLWATQRVGFLSAEKRKAGGTSPEIDEEIRMLGERYGIPTEFTSYLVLEPGMVGARRNTTGAGVAGGIAAAAPPPTVQRRRDEQFEMAKQAAELRDARSLVAVDMAAPVSANAAEPLRKVSGRPFVRRDGVWTDVRYQPTMKTVSVKAYSKAYFDLVAQLPELRAIFALGDKVIAVGRTGAIAVGDSGTSELSAGELARIVREW